MVPEDWPSRSRNRKVFISGRSARFRETEWSFEDESGSEIMKLIGVCPSKIAMRFIGSRTANFRTGFSGVLDVLRAFSKRRARGRNSDHFF
jgi:hypothetical protein